MVIKTAIFGLYKINFDMKIIVNVFSFFLFTALLMSCGNKTISTGDNFDLVELPDQSIVYLNKNSSVSFDSDFEDRKIKLEGEGFFSVMPGEVPFVVTTETGEITVVGTEFNVKSRGDELEVEVEEGEVKLKTDDHDNGLKRGQSGIFIKGKGDLKIGKAKFKFKLWMGDLEIEFKKVGKDFKRTGKEIKKSTKHLDKDLNKGEKKMEKGFKKLKKDLN